jgi:hypothetical protein
MFRLSVHRRGCQVAVKICRQLLSAWPRHVSANTISVTSATAKGLSPINRLSQALLVGLFFRLSGTARCAK